MKRKGRGEGNETALTERGAGVIMAPCEATMLKSVDIATATGIALVFILWFINPLSINEGWWQRTCGVYFFI